VSHHHFKNETVPLDGCAYKQSSFENVTFVYQGKAPFEIDDVEYKQGTIRTMTSNGALISPNPKIIAMSRGHTLAS